MGSVLDEIETLIERSIKKRAVGEFTMPGLMKITTVKKPARKARNGEQDAIHGSVVATLPPRLMPRSMRVLVEGLISAN